LPGSMLGGRAVATKSIVVDPLEQAASEGATLSSTSFPTASFAVGARSDRDSEAGSIDHPPPGAAQATRASLSVNGLLPMAASIVSANAKRGASNSASAATIGNK
ncbi:MAG: hypothetical protein ABW061_19125, partial [Polyangiaceae bacterium]